ncbi:hypothetical protein FIBSPDRAFT_684936, partial [Athelia psychrophila]
DTNPFAPAHIAKILDLVQIGDDLSVEERAEVVELISRYADVYALSVSEVCLV